MHSLNQSLFLGDNPCSKKVFCLYQIIRWIIVQRVQKRFSEFGPELFLNTAIVALPSSFSPTPPKASIDAETKPLSAETPEPSP